jgi:hypothetical protein
MGGPGLLGIFELERGLRRCASSPKVYAATTWWLPWAQGQAKPATAPTSRIHNGPPFHGRGAQGRCFVLTYSKGGCYAVTAY